MNLISRTDREQFTISAIFKQLSLAGIPLSCLTEDKDWRINNTISKEKSDEWKQWFIAECRNTLKFTKKEAEEEFVFFEKKHGLTKI